MREERRVPARKEAKAAEHRDAITPNATTTAFAPIPLEKVSLTHPIAAAALRARATRTARQAPPAAPSAAVPTVPPPPVGRPAHPTPPMPAPASWKPTPLARTDASIDPPRPEPAGSARYAAVPPVTTPVKPVAPVTTPREATAAKPTGGATSIEPDLPEVRATRRSAAVVNDARAVATAMPAPRTTVPPVDEGALDGLSWDAVPGHGRIPPHIGAPDSPIATEQYRKLAGSLLRAQEAHAINVVMVASALPSEGKSLTTAALAHTLANSYRRNVLVIDADLRLSSMHEVFSVANTAGLSDYLDVRHRSVVSPVEVVPGLTLLTAGRATNDPVGGLTSARMRQLLTEASRRFDWVLIDTPPVTLLPDANLLTAMVDGAVLVIAAGETQFPFLTRAVAALGRDRILGVVLNRARQGVHLKSYAYSNGY
jgi:capsular exopolysaccharide synthesis family protein